MPTTRKQQQTLNVEKTDEGVGKVEMKTEGGGGQNGSDNGKAATADAAAGDKRKQGETDDDDDDDSGKDQENPDERTANGRNGADEEQSSRPSKAAKTEGTKGGDDEKAAPADADTNGKAESTSAPSAAAPAASAEKKVSGEDTSGSSSNAAPWSVLERGHVYFFYRPKVQPAEKADNPEPSADSISSVQNFHMLLLPRASDSETAPAKPEADRPSDAQSKSEQTGEKARKGGIGARLIRLGKKRMPEPNAALAQGDQPGGIGGDSSEAIWAVVSDVATDVDELKDSFARREYSTKTSGQRVVQGARLAGRGWYTLSASQTDPPSSREVRLSYVLSHPSSDADFGDVQSELGLQRESSVRLTMRNPTLPSTGDGAPPAGLDPSSRAELSKDELEKTFGGAADDDGATRYARPEDVSLLDRAGVELLVIKRKEQEKEDDAVGLGDTQQKAVEKLARDDAQRLDNDDVIRGELKLDAEENPPDALDGEWI